MKSITLRDAHYSELPAIAHLAARAFWNDNLFGDFIHPHRNQFPDDNDLFYLRRNRANFWNYRWKWLVAVETDKTEGTEVIVGAAQWVRLGPGGRSMECFVLDPRNLLEPLSRAAMKVHALLWPNRACDPATEDVLDRAYPFFKHVWGGEREEAWYLDILVVDPDSQVTGIGRKLTEWGLDQAAKDGIYASVISAKGKEGFYYRVGFEFELGSAGMGEGNPIADVEGGKILWKKPPGKTTPH